jgi:hypothetical protein
MIALRRSAFCLLLCCGACSLDPAAKGETCTRSSQCAPGLGCVYPAGDSNAKEGHCGADLSSLYDPSQVPMLTPDAGLQVADAAVDAGSSVGAADASTSPAPTSPLPTDASTNSTPIETPADAG